MQRAKLVKLINKKITGIANGFFNDDFWHGHNIIVNAIKELEQEYKLDFYLASANYFHSDEGIPIGKKWIHQYDFKKIPIVITIIASGAGTVKDPLSVYDIVAYAS